MYTDGYGYSEISKKLNELGYHPKRGGNFGKNSMNSILANEKYTGVYIFNRLAPKDSNGKRNGNAFKSAENIIRVEGGCPAIISKELFQKAQKRKAAIKRNTGQYHSKEFYLLTGKVFCGICGKRCQGNLRFSGRSKTRMVTYRCGSLRRLCKNKENNKDYLDAYIVELLRKKIFNKKSLKWRIKAVNSFIKKYNDEFDANHETLSVQLSEIMESLNRITDAIERGMLTETLIERAEQLEKERFALQTQLNSMRTYQPLVYSDFEHLIDEFHDMPRSTNEFRTFVQNYVDKIVTYPYHLEITLDVGFGVTDELKETITIRRGDLYALFESRVKEE